MKISWKGTDGVIVEVGSVSTVIDTKSGRRLHVPNGDLMGQVFETAPD